MLREGRWRKLLAVFPTPDLPISTGLFFVFRPKIWISRASSSSRPITGSS